MRNVVGTEPGFALCQEPGRVALGRARPVVAETWGMVVWATVRAGPSRPCRGRPPAMSRGKDLAAGASPV
jgi:hypothetical protein